MSLYKSHSFSFLQTSTVQNSDKSKRDNTLILDISRISSRGKSFQLDQDLSYLRKSSRPTSSQVIREVLKHQELNTSRRSPVKIDAVSRIGSFELVKEKMKRITLHTRRSLTSLDLTMPPKLAIKQQNLMNRIMKKASFEKMDIDGNTILDYTLKKEFERNTKIKKEGLLKRSLSVGPQRKKEDPFYPITSLSVQKIKKRYSETKNFLAIYSKTQTEFLKSYRDNLGQPQRKPIICPFLRDDDPGSIILKKISAKETKG